MTEMFSADYTPGEESQRTSLDRTSLEIAICILAVLILRGIFIFGFRKKNPALNPLNEDIQPTEEVVFILALILMAISIAFWFRMGWSPPAAFRSG